MIIQCPQCCQKLKIPDNVGGMLMECPSCGQKLYSDFKIGAPRKASQASEPDKTGQSPPHQKTISGFSVKV